MDKLTSQKEMDTHECRNAAAQTTLHNVLQLFLNRVQYVCLSKAGRTYPLLQGQKKKKYSLWCYFHIYSVCLGIFFIICLINFHPVINQFLPFLLYYTVWKMVWKSYFICRCICALKIGTDLQRQVRYTVCSIRVQNTLQRSLLNICFDR